MTATTATNKLHIVQEVRDIIQDCLDDNMEHMISMQVCMYLKNNYGYDRSEATQLLIGVELIQELGLLND